MTVFDGFADKPWLVCDNTATSPFYGYCYSAFSDGDEGGKVKVSTSVDGGLTWGPAVATAGISAAYGVQPVVQPDGTVVVPTDDNFHTAIRAFRSYDGGASWSRPTQVAKINWHPPAGQLRDVPIPTAGVDASGRVYVVWEDCRFRVGCRSNDLVIRTSSDGRRRSVSRSTRSRRAPTTSFPGSRCDRAPQGPARSWR